MYIIHNYVCIYKHKQIECATKAKQYFIYIDGILFIDVFNT